MKLFLEVKMDYSHVVFFLKLIDRNPGTGNNQSGASVLPSEKLTPVEVVKTELLEARKVNKSQEMRFIFISCIWKANETKYYCFS